MNTHDIENSFLGGIDITTFVTYLIWAFIGFLASICIELLRHRSKIKTNGGFSFGYWIKDNFIRIILSLIAILVGIMFTKQLIGWEPGNLGSFVAGLLTDKIVEAIVKIKNTELPALWKKE